jgi:hypothetical protein
VGPKRKKDDVTPFIFLEGSSGIGKTQTAFSIMSAFQFKHVYYWVHRKVGLNSQKIYNSVTLISSLFCLCVEKDMERVTETSPVPVVLLKMDLYLFGFILTLLKTTHGQSNIMYDNENMVSIRPVTGETVQKFLCENYSEMHPIFLLDECMEDSHTIPYNLKFIRKVFTYLKLGLVMLGTDSRISQLTKTYGNHSRGIGSFTWCFVFSQYPSLHSDYIDQIVDPRIKDILQHSRPLFGTIAYPWLVENQQKFRYDFAGTCNEWFKQIFAAVATQKRIFSNHNSRVGQIRLFLNTYHSMNESPLSLIHYHFAKLYAPSCFKLLSDDKIMISLSEWDGFNIDMNIEWNPKSLFPLLSEDLLLYLCFMGGKEFSAFYWDVPLGKTKSLILFWNDCTKVPLFRDFLINVDNVVQPSNDGMHFEAITCACVCLASHFNGINGILLHQFLLHLGFNLQVTPSMDPENYTIDNMFLLDPYQKYHIPYLSPSNCDWPEFVQQFGFFGNFSRTKNVDRIDMKAIIPESDWIISGECKDFGHNININVMIKILNRIPKMSLLHFVFVRNLQDSYFKKTSMETYKNPKIVLNVTKAKKRDYYKIDLTCSRPAISPISGLPNGRNTKSIVLFVICPRPNDYKSNGINPSPELEQVDSEVMQSDFDEF